MKNRDYLYNKLYAYGSFDAVNFRLVKDNFKGDLPKINGVKLVSEQLEGYSFKLFTEHAKAESKSIIHFFTDDFRLERLWKKPEYYADFWKKFDYVCSPDFSTYTDMPMPLQVWNLYRSMLIASHYESHGCKVIPTVLWSDERSYRWFENYPKDSAVSISTLGVNNAEAKLFFKGLDRMIETISPSVIVVYGNRFTEQISSITDKAIFFKPKKNYRNEKD